MGEHVGHSEFIEYATMFKLPVDRPEGIKTEVVLCVNCGEDYLLEDLLSGELEEDWCPSCRVCAGEHWKDKTFRPVPADN